MDCDKMDDDAATQEDSKGMKDSTDSTSKGNSTSKKKKAPSKRPRTPSSTPAKAKKKPRSKPAIVPAKPASSTLHSNSNNDFDLDDALKATLGSTRVLKDAKKKQAQLKRDEKDAELNVKRGLLLSVLKAEKPFNTLKAESKASSVAAEVEVRLGSVLPQRNSFSSSIPRCIFEEIRDRCLLMKARNQCFQEDLVEIDYCFRHPLPSGGTRLTVDPETKKVTTCLLKKPLIPKIDIPAHHQCTTDIRFSACSEEEFEVAPDTEIPADWESRRTKRRSSFVINESVWRVDLTTVDVEIPLRPFENNTLYEAELEMSWPDEITEQFKQTAAFSLWHLVRMLIGKMEIYLEDVLDAKQSDLRNLSWQCLPPDHRKRGHRHEDFPGAMPVAFSRRFFPQVQNGEYLISEKTDGVRYMLLVLPPGHETALEETDGVYLVGRKNVFHQVKNCKKLRPALATNGITMLDGEMVLNIKTQQRQFMIFDVLKYDGEDIAERILSERVKYIRNPVESYRRLVQQQLREDERPPFELIGKMFNSNLGAILKHVHKMDHHRIFTDNQKRYHKTDGFIFAPNEAYKPKGVANLFKWKYPDMLSVDFEVRQGPNDGTITLYCCGDSNAPPMKCRDVTLTDGEKLKWDAIMQRKVKHHDQTPAILEMHYDPWSGVWIIDMERPDKDRPNHVSVVMDTMEAVSEGVTQQELTYRLNCRHHNDDWAEKWRKALNTIQRPPPPAVRPPVAVVERPQMQSDVV